MVKCENIRHLLGEMIVFGQRTGSGDDVALTLAWNKMPVAVREWLLGLAKESLPKLIEDTNKQADERVAKIEKVLAEIESITDLDAEKIAIACGPFEEDPRQLSLLDGTENQGN